MPLWQECKEAKKVNTVLSYEACHKVKRTKHTKAITSSKYWHDLKYYDSSGNEMISLTLKIYELFIYHNNVLLIYNIYVLHITLPHLLLQPSPELTWAMPVFQTNVRTIEFVYGNSQSDCFRPPRWVVMINNHWLIFISTIHAWSSPQTVLYEKRAHVH
jgi:hypothetical protein